LPAAQDFRNRTAHGALASVRLCRWRESLEDRWTGLRFGGLEVHEEDGHYTFDVEVLLNGLDPRFLQVQLFAESQNGTEPEVHPMERRKEARNPAAACPYRVRIPVKRPAGEYTPRIIPAFEGAFVPIEAGYILWYR
jgi:glycogen phosphorylase